MRVLRIDPFNFSQVLRISPRTALVGVLVLLPWVKLELYPRIIWADALFLLFGGMVVLQGVLLRYSFHAPKIIMLFGALIAFWITAVIASGWRVVYISAYTFETMVYLYVGLLSWLLAYTMTFSEKVFQSAFKALMVGFIIVLTFGGIGLLEVLLFGRFSPLFYSKARKLIAVFKFPNQLAGFLVLFFPIVIMQSLHARSWKERLFYGGWALLTLIEIVASGSRTGLVAAFFGLGLCVLFALSRLHLRYIMLVGVLTVGLGLAVAYLEPHIQVIHRAFSALQLVLHGEITDPFRRENWRIALQIFKRFPFTGYGVANVALDYGYEPHNTYLAVAAETGVLGLFAFSALLAFVLVLAWHNTRLVKYAPQWFGWAYGLWFGLLAEMLYATQHHILRTRHLWVTFGLIVALNVWLRRARRGARFYTELT